MVKKDAEEKPQETQKETRYYWTAAKRHQLGGWVKEVRATNGMIVTPEQPLQIDNHVLITDDPEVIAFVEKSYSFKMKSVVPVKDLNEGNLMTARLQMEKKTSIYKGETIEKDTPEQSSQALVDMATVVSGS